MTQVTPLLLTTCTAAFLTVAACSSGGAGAGQVTLDGSDIGPVSSVTCATDDGVTTITMDAPQQTRVVLTDEDQPAVRTVSIGEAGSDGPSLVVLEGVSAVPDAQREGQTYTITGSGTGTQAADPASPTELGFEITATCP